MPDPSLENIRIVVSEKHGIRRFLYPVEVKIPSKFDSEIAILDENGKAIPSEFIGSGEHETNYEFAISLAPLQTRTFTIRKAIDGEIVIPDPLKLSQSENDVVINQDRVTYTFGIHGALKSVVYDEIEHLSGAIATGFVDNEERQDAGARSQWIGNGLCALIQNRQDGTNTSLTCCKSWVHVSRSRPKWNGRGNSYFRIPLSLTSSVQTCDFGFGNGAYARIEKGVIDQVSVLVDFSNADQPSYEIGSYLFGHDKMRLDYAGTCSSWEDAVSRCWLHWIEPTKALALAVPQIAKDTSQIRIDIDSNGAIMIEIQKSATCVLGHHTSESDYGVTYHFLNAIPPIAAATNPASIICKPEVRVEIVNV